VVVLAGANRPFAGVGQLSRARGDFDTRRSRNCRVREARTSGAAASSDSKKIAGRIVEYGTAVEKATWSML
jgi:hypothetical protein